MTESPGFGPLNFRLPISPKDRESIDAPAIDDGSVLAGWPNEALIIRGRWNPVPARALMLRPIFPGAMRFIADEPKLVPRLETIAVDANGNVTAAGLKTCALTGKLLIRVLPAAHAGEMRKSGTLDALAVEPSWAIYGPVRLSEAFLGETLLSREQGLFKRPLKVDGKDVPPTDPRWEALVLQSFVAGGLGPNLRCEAKLDDDDAGKMSMPELVVEGADRTFALAIVLGWLRAPEKGVQWPLGPEIEIVPTIPFLRHIGTKLRETVVDQPKGSLLDLIFEGEETSKGWHDRLHAGLQALGFGDIAGQMPLEAVIREFQISASAAVVATAGNKVIDQAQLALRDFRDLVAAQNDTPYAGPVSGRANQETRRLIRSWTALGLRSPLIIAAFAGLDDNDLEVPHGKAATHNDLWHRKETEKRELRMFVADFTRLAPGTALHETGLEPIGYYGIYRAKNTGGPASLPVTPARRIPYAEFRPGRAGLNEALLAAAKPGEEFHPAASTFRVIRAVAEIECLGHLDQINAFDDAGISYGPCHWSLALADRDASVKTELGGLAAYLHYLDKEGITPGVDVFAPQGLRPYVISSKDIAAAPREKSNGAFVWRLGLIDDRGESRKMSTDDVLKTIPSWRNFYRWVAIGRRDRLIGPATWAMALRRLHQLMHVGFPKDKLTAFHQKEMPSPMIKDVFTSELAVALLMRWHVKKPNTVVTTAKKNKIYVPGPNKHIITAYQNAAQEADPKKRDAWQAALVETLKDEAEKVEKELKEDFNDMIEQPWWNDPTKDRGHKIDRALTTLNAAHGSFALLDPYPGPSLFSVALL